MSARIQNRTQANANVKVGAGAKAGAQGPAKTVSEFNGRQRVKTDADLAKTKTHLEAKVKDAKTGPHKDAKGAVRADAQLKLVEGEQKLRAELKAGPHGKFALEAHGQSDAQLKTTEKKLEAKIKDASAGGDATPAAAAEAKAQLSLVKQEQTRRAQEAKAGDLPKNDNAKPLSNQAREKFEVGLRDDPKAGLEARLKTLEAKQKDASTGANRDPMAAKNYAKQSAEVKAELGYRAKLESGPDPKFALEAHGKTDAQLKTDIQAQQKILVDAKTGGFQDPAKAKEAQSNLNILRAEVAYRQADNRRDRMGQANPYESGFTPAQNNKGPYIHPQPPPQPQQPPVGINGQASSSSTANAQFNPGFSAESQGTVEV